VREGTPGGGRPASGRTKGEIEQARDLRLGAWQAILAGVFIGWGAIALKAGLNELFSGETGYVLLMAAAVLAAWFGGLSGGLAATITALVLNEVVFLGAADLTISRVDQLRQVLYFIVATGTAALVATRRASRDRLVDALDKVADLAETVGTRDARLELVLAASGTGFWEWDLATDELAWSDTIFEQHGMAPGGRTPTFEQYVEMIHPDDQESFRKAIGSVLDGAPAFMLDFRIRASDGAVAWIHAAGRMFRDEAGQAIRMIGTSQDITENRRLEEERDQLLADERRAGEFREAFIDVISHELRTPITTILGLTQILARPGRADDAASRAALLDDVRAESERLHRLVEDLLVLSRVERGRLDPFLEPLEPRRLLERIANHEALDLPSIRIETRLEPDLPIVAGESTYVEQIMRNLLGNAAKYTAAGTRVVVSARRRGATIEVRVSDDGPGIPETSVGRAFELFYRDPDSAKIVSGSGIGLFVCSSLVEAMGGRIWAQRRPEGGSEFGFTMRVLEADAVDAGAIELDDVVVDPIPIPDAVPPRARSGAPEPATSGALSRESRPGG
jgi:two-component system CheB/CheR fusion protein